MKLLLLALIAFALPLHAADEEATPPPATPVEATPDIYRMSFGAQLGLNISSTRAPAQEGNKAGLVLGAFAEAPVLPGFLYVQPELNYIQKGGGAVRMNYLDFPLLAKIRFIMPRVRPFVLGGPRLAYLLSTDGLPKSAFSAVELGITLGGGAQYMLSDTTYASLTARYTFAVNEAAPAWKTNGFEILAGIGF